MTAFEKNGVQNNAADNDSNNLAVTPERPSFFKQAVDNTIAVADSRIVFFLCLLIFPITVIAYFPSRGDGDYDIWFHLAYGREYVQNLTWILDHSQFSWTPAHTDWRYVSWIGSALFFLAHEIAGITGIYILHYLVLIGAFVCLALYARAAGFRMNVTILTALLIAFIAIKILIIIIKPENFTVLFFFLSTAIYFHGRQSEKRDFFWVYPILFLIWVNTHGGFFIGLIFLGLALALETISRFLLPGQAMPWPRYKRLMLFSGLAIPATMINPHGALLHLDIFEMAIGRLAGQYIETSHQHIVALGSMWQFVFFTKKLFYLIISAWALLLMGASFMILMIVYAGRKNRIPWVMFGLNLFFFLFSMSLARAVIFYPPVWFCSMLFLAREMGDLHVPRKAAPAALLIFLATSVFTPWTLLVVEGNTSSWFGSNLAEYAPVKEVDFIKENNLPGPIFNDYVTGSYMMWAMYPDYKVFIDSRRTVYDTSVLDDYFNLKWYVTRKDGIDLLRTKYEFNIALIHMRQPGFINWLVSSPDWSMVYFDKVAAVLIHRSIMHRLSRETRAMDVGPQRFKELKNPIVLMNLFDFYKNFGPKLAEDIRNTYDRNVSSMFRLKKSGLKYMDDILKSMKQEQPLVPAGSDSGRNRT